MLSHLRLTDNFEILNVNTQYLTVGKPRQFDIRILSVRKMHCLRILEHNWFFKGIIELNIFIFLVSKVNKR